MAFPAILIGEVVELLVRAYVLGDRFAALIGASPAEKKIVAPPRSLALRLVA
jgi:hypothetical protein